MNWIALAKTKKDPPFKTFLLVWRNVKGEGFPRLASLEEVKTICSGKLYSFRDANNQDAIYDDVTHYCIPEPPKE